MREDMKGKECRVSKRRQGGERWLQDRLCFIASPGHMVL